VNLFQVAHDLRNPISSIISACEYLTTYSPEDLQPDQREMIAQIESSAVTLLRLSQQLSKSGKPKSRNAARGESGS
jgi:signal transduction histidine kinase